MYKHNEIEEKWQKYWESHQTFKTKNDYTNKKKFYCLDMFPYPSGAGLHVGHPEGYTATDIVSRYKRMNGYNVLHPMGWDAFGLPAERHAVRTGQHPEIITNKNCDNFRSQLKKLGFSYDWDREINTTDPKYYKWTQYIFKILFDRGLAYEVEAPVNWCPALGTVLANEEVKDGKYVETGDAVEKKYMKQWMLKITAYAERLLNDIDDLDWPEGIKHMQREWIGKSTGADVVFKVKDTNDAFTVFTTRPDTLFGATYCVLAPEHSLVKTITSPEKKAEVEAYVKKAAAKSAQDRMKDEKEKTGAFTGAYAVNPVNGKEIPIYIADYVLGDYGYGAIMAVPAHDERDFAFAQKFNIPVIEVIKGGDVTKEAYIGDGELVNSGFLNGMRVKESKKKMCEWLEAHGCGKATTTYKLRDWLFSRQRYWGEPFPILHMEDGTVKSVDVKDLPIILPELDEYKPTADGKPPLERATEWVNTTDKETGKKARRETNTMPQWAGSSWYFLRFADPHNDNEPFSKEAADYWLPVDFYLGGAEHAVLHLLYARFWHKVLYDAGIVSTKEPFQKLFNQGMILAYSYRDDNGKYYYPKEVERRSDGAYYARETGVKVNTQIEKMSKSRFNVVNPDDVVRDYGADSMRLYEMFMGPLDRDKPWTDEGINGVNRFLKRVWNMYVTEDDKINPAIKETAPSPAMLKEINKLVKGVTGDIEGLLFNTAIAKMMEFVNFVSKETVLDKESMEKFVLVMAPFAPHIAEELWSRLGHGESLAYAPWPAFDEKHLKESEIVIPVQVMGKLRSTVKAAPDADEQTVVALAKADEKVMKYLDGKQIVKTVYVKNRMLNFVVK